ncbi:MAG TPA: putative lipid II flippase FtsW [Acidimicrobiales bacterium]|nr:putative lipid II flippase FtsW [Acidimicrobiales bacterium]
MSGAVEDARRRARQAPGPAGWVMALRSAPTATVLVGVVAALCVFGLVMVGSASSVVSLDLYGSPWAIFVRECIWMALGSLAFLAAWRVDYRSWRRLAPGVLAVTFFLLLLVLVPGIGVRTLGSSRWIGFGQLRLQPSELMKLAIVLFGADLLARRAERGSGYRTMTGPLLLVAGAAALLIVLQPDMGTAIVVCCIALALLFASGVPLRPVAKVLAGLALVGVLVAAVSPYRRSRILSFLHPGAHASGSGYQVAQSLIGLGSGHLFGLGLGSSRQKWGYLPNAHTDFIFSVLGEELGLLGALLVVALLGALAWFGLRAALRAPDRFGALVAVAVVTWISAEAAINIGAVIGLVPVTGIPLPFISFGGSSLVITMLASGLLVNVARHERRPDDDAGPRRARRHAPAPPAR